MDSGHILGRNWGYLKGATDVNTVYEDITNLGAIFGVPDKAKALIDGLRARVAAAQVLRGEAERPRVAYVNVFEDKLYALSGLSYAAQLEGVDALNIFGDIKESFAEISPEKVLTLNADAIVYSYGNAQEPEAEQRAAIVKLLLLTLQTTSSRPMRRPGRRGRGRTTSRQPHGRRHTLSYASERIEWDDDAAHHIRTRSQRYPDAVDIEPEWTTEAVDDPDRIVDEPDPLSAHANSVRVVGYSHSSALLITVVALRDRHGVLHGATAWPTTGKQRRQYREGPTDD